MHTFTAHQSRIRSIAIDPENKALITGSIDGELKVSLIIDMTSLWYTHVSWIDLGCQYI